MILSREESERFRLVPGSYRPTLEGTDGGEGLNAEHQKLLIYLVCSHACHAKSPANNAAVPSADSGLEK
jgi:hypothetical protein